MKYSVSAYQSSNSSGSTAAPGPPSLGGPEHPPPLGGEPGATKKGCSVHSEEMPGALIVALAGILGLRRRRR